MKKLLISALVTAFFVLALSGSSIRADNEDNSVRARLNGFQEVPSKLTNGHGTFTAVISGSSISYTLTFSGLTTTALASHIHFAQPGVNGGIFAFLCGGGGKPACPAAGGTVTGTITAADILAPTPDQGLAA
ncbi:MAG TPA: CHRD domain-containing protein, partial [Anaerolineae bacterium]